MEPKEVFDRKYEVYRNLLRKPAIPLEARQMIFDAMEEYAQSKGPSEEDKMVFDESINAMLGNLVNLFVGYWDYSEHNNGEPYPSKVEAKYRAYENYKKEIIKWLDSKIDPTKI